MPTDIYNWFFHAATRKIFEKPKEVNKLFTGRHPAVNDEHGYAKQLHALSRISLATCLACRSVDDDPNKLRDNMKGVGECNCCVGGN